MEEAGNFASAMTVWDLMFWDFVYGPGRAFRYRGQVISLVKVRPCYVGTTL